MPKQRQGSKGVRTLTAGLGNDEFGWNECPFREVVDQKVAEGQEQAHGEV